MASLPLTMSYREADTHAPFVHETLGGLLRRIAAETPEQTALIEGTPDPATRRSWSYQELLDEAIAIARTSAITTSLGTGSPFGPRTALRDSFFSSPSGWPGWYWWQ